MARRRSPEAPPAPDELWCPDWLRCGRCFEVWTPERPTPVADNWLDWSVRCSHRFRNARNAWYELHDLDFRANNDPRVPVALRQGGAPWSVRAAVEHGDLGDRLVRLGLAADWTPAPAPKAVRSLPTYGDPPADAVRLLRGESP